MLAGWNTIPVLLIAAGGLLIVGVSVLFAYRTPDRHEALVVDRSDGLDVAVDGAFCLPVFHDVETVDLSLVPLQIDRRGEEAVRCDDGTRVDLSVVFLLRVNDTDDAIRELAVDAEGATDSATVRRRCLPELTESLEQTVRNEAPDDLIDHRMQFCEELLYAVGVTVDAYRVVDAAVVSVDRAPTDFLDLPTDFDARRIDRLVDAKAERRADLSTLEASS